MVEIAISQVVFVNLLVFVAAILCLVFGVMLTFFMKWLREKLNGAPFFDYIWEDEVVVYNVLGIVLLIVALMLFNGLFGFVILNLT